MPNPRFLSSRLARYRPGSRRVLILALAAVAVLLQGALQFGMPRLDWPRAGGSVASVPASTASAPSVTPRPPGAAEGPGAPHPTLTVPPPPGVPVPEGAVLLYEQSPAATGSPGTAVPGTLRRPLTPPDLLRGILRMKADGRLDLTQAQARRLAEAVRGLGAAYGDMNRAREEILRNLTQDQRAWLVAHPPADGEVPSGPPEQNALEPAARALDALDGTR